MGEAFTWLMQQADRIGAWALALIFIYAVLRRPKPYLYTASHYEEVIARLTMELAEWKDLAKKGVAELQASTHTISECLIFIKNDNANLNQKVDSLLKERQP